MNFDLTDEQQEIRRLVRDFADGEVRPVAEELDREKRFPYELVTAMAELGLMGMTIPEEYGGGGTDTLSYALAIEELTRIDSSVAVTVGFAQQGIHAPDLPLEPRCQGDASRHAVRVHYVGARQRRIVSRPAREVNHQRQPGRVFLQF